MEKNMIERLVARTRSLYEKLQVRNQGTLPGEIRKSFRSF